MKRIVSVLMAIVLLTACTKENTSTTPVAEKTYFRIESVGKDGKVVYSNIAVVK